MQIILNKLTENLVLKAKLFTQLINMVDSIKESYSSQVWSK